MREIRKLLILLGMGNLLFLTAVASAFAEPLLVDDFSFLTPYVRASQLNPYWRDAGLPLWGNTTNPSDDAYHTNHLGLYSASGPYDGIANVEWGGFRGFGWNASQTTWWWYTVLAADLGVGRDISSYYYLTLRIRGLRGKLGNDQGERLEVKIDDIYNRYHTEYLNPYLPQGVTTEWQTVKIPLSDYANTIDLTKAKAVSLVFHASDIRDHGAPEQQYEVVFFDDIALMPALDSVPAADGVTKLSVNPPVKIDNNKQLSVNGQPFFIKGVGYDPVPVGQTTLWPPTDMFTPEHCQRDFPLLAYMGVNTIRTWGQINDDLIDYGTTPYGIKLSAGFWIPYEISFLNGFAKSHIKQDFLDYVTRYKNEPSLLMWVIGNENNLFNGYDWRWYAFANELAKAAYQLEGSSYHPVAIVEGDKDTIGNVQLGSDNAHLNYVDIVGYNLYRGKTFTNFFSVYSAKTNKALWIAEYGVDAWHSHSLISPWDGYENEQQQSYYDVSAWVDVVRNKTKNIGATVMSYADGWWKDVYYFTNDDWSHPEDPRHLSIHDFGGSILGSLPDGFANEEWWGIVKLDPNNPMMVIPRQVFSNLYSTTIAGKVLGYGKVPIVNATVKLTGPRSYTTQTDEQGLYQVTQIQPGRYTVRVLSSVYYSPVYASVSDKKTVVVDFLK
jgi:hypothetical protein